ncbi:hypothetical protein HHL28_01460 [Aerophototrophica crusticola]|uniref:Uncharacterized protein n=1 Tax=Aerophototrophica crusticola TaxID=1709002 RepID=A0A858R3H4_9PROT|nr:hypothetical protein HHL28_01460 [Rhodospirillaceae bacterium B3]
MSSGSETLSLDLAQITIILELGRTIAPEAEALGLDSGCGDGGCLEGDGTTVND